MVTNAETATKHCPKCGHTKELRRFPLDERSDDGHDRYCRLCRTVYRSLRFTGPMMRSLAEPDLIPLDPVAYAQRLARLQRIVDEVDARMRWPGRRIVATEPGQCPDFVVATATSEQEVAA